MAESLGKLIARVKACTLCADDLPLGPRPVLQAAADARILIVGQAPGTKVHATGVPFDDPSGNRLREWMGVDHETFYDANKVALLPMGFCYPGKGTGGDLPPDPRCAQTWRQPLLGHLKRIELTIVLGAYAQAWHLTDVGKTLTETVKRWQEYAPDVVPAPHPSPRNNRWLRNNPWFESEVVPYLQERVSLLLHEGERRDARDD